MTFWLVMQAILQLARIASCKTAHCNNIAPCVSLHEKSASKSASKSVTFQKCQCQVQTNPVLISKQRILYFQNI